MTQDLVIIASASGLPVLHCLREVMHIDFELPVGLRVAQPCRYCFYSVVQKWVFCPTGATLCPDKREIWHGGRGERSAPSYQISRLSGIQPPKLSKFLILAINLYLRGDSFAIFLRNSQYLYASIGSF